jgi:Domain of unknown function (DUF222)
VLWFLFLRRASCVDGYWGGIYRVTPLCDDGNMCSTVLPEIADLERMDPRQLADTVQELDRVRRRAEMLLAEAVGVAERSTAYTEDGHASVAGWLRATCNTSKADATAFVQCSRLLQAIPEARSAAAAGRLGVAQTRLMARVFANPRCADQLPGSAALLVGHAEGLWFDEFRVVIERWQTLADADGAHADHERAHRDRDAHVSITGARTYLDARGGVVAGSMIEEIFQKFCDTEFCADWDTGRAKWGDRMTPGLLERTPAQRRFDALLAVFLAAAGGGTAGACDPLVNIIVDQTTLEHHLTRLAGATTAPLDPATVDDRRCETTAGVPVDPVDMLAAALTGHVRRVVMDSAGVVIDLGRRSRLFTGGSRDAVLLGDRWCLWPGCDNRSGRCQTDHTTPWARDGPTRPGNGGPACGRHNLWKQRHGYITTRDPTGQWHTYRPDGTEITPLNATNRARNTIPDATATPVAGT